MRANEFITEAFDQPYTMKWQKGEHGDYDALAKLRDGSNLHIMFEKVTPYEWNISFYRNNSQEVTGEGDAQRVFATVLSAIQNFIKKEHPVNIFFSASKATDSGEETTSRAKLYNRMVRRYAQVWGYDLLTHDNGDLVMYELTSQKHQLEESPFNEVQENPVKFNVETPDNFKHSFQITLTVHGKYVGHFNFVRDPETDDVTNEVEVESRFQGQGYGKLLLLKAIEVANSHRLDFQQDIRGITDAQQNVYDSLENAGYIVTPGDGFWFLTPQGEQELGTLSEDISRRGFLGGLAGAAALGATGAQAKMHPNSQSITKNPKVEFLLKWARHYIKDPAELAAFMAQCAHESDNFNTVEEYGTPERFMHKYDIQFNPAKAKALGNDKPGDGAKYHGRGYLQLTGKYNYSEASKAISKAIGKTVDFVAHPEWVASPEGAVLTSIWYWKNFVKPKIKNFSNTKQVTTHINPGLRGEKNREKQAKDWQTALNVKPHKQDHGIKVASR